MTPAERMAIAAKAQRRHESPHLYLGSSVPALVKALRESETERAAWEAYRAQNAPKGDQHINVLCDRLAKAKAALVALGLLP